MKRRWDLHSGLGTLKSWYQQKRCLGVRVAPGQASASSSCSKGLVCRAQPKELPSCPLGGLTSPDLLMEKGWEVSAPSLVLTITAPNNMALEQPPVPCPAQSLDPEVPWLAAAASTPFTRKIPINP